MWVPFKRKPRVESPYGDLTSRVVAMTIDMLLIYIIVFPISLMLGGLLFPEMGMTRSATLLEREQELILLGYKPFGESVAYLWDIGMLKRVLLDYAVQIVGIGVIATYVCNRFGTTPGLRLFGLQIVNEHDHGHPPLRQWIVRFFGLLLDAVTLMIGYIWIGIHPKKQGWHDMLAKTVVMKRKALQAEHLAKAAAEEAEETDPA